MRPGPFSFSTSRSAVVLTGSQVVAMAAGFIAQIAVARLLLPAAYGSFAVALSVLIWVEPLVSGGLTLALAQAVSTDLRKLPDSVRWVKRIFIPYALVVWGAYSAASSLIASALGDSRLKILLLVAGLELPSIAVLAASRELLMGVGASGRQAAVIGGYALLRASCIIVLAAATHSAVGTLGGNALAALAAAGIAVILLRPSISRSIQPPPPAVSSDSLPASVLRAGVPTLVLVLLTQFALTIDLWIVKRVMPDPQAIGWYAAGRSFAFIPYMLATGLNLALFPAVCSELGKGNRIRALSLTREAVRVLIVCLVPLCAIVVPTASPLARLLFSEQFAGAALPIRVLTIGLSCFSIVGTMQAVLIADSRSLFNSVFAGALSITALILCSGMVPAYGLPGAAWAITLTGVAGASFLGLYVCRRLGTVVPLASVIRVTAASVSLYLLARAWHVNGLWLIGQYIVFTSLYAVFLLGFGEITRGDLHVARAVASDLWRMIQRPWRSDWD
ncbi:MAG: lipopolysaccharide biosynthesis protein [Candidatus Binatia bacterium]